MGNESHDDGTIPPGAELTRCTRYPIAFLRWAHYNAQPIRRLGIVFDSGGQDGDNRTNIKRG
jgi:hypothetical protein